MYDYVYFVILFLKFMSFNTHNQKMSEIFVSSSNLIILGLIFERVKAVKLTFFQVFHFELYFYFHNHKSS